MATDTMSLAIVPDGPAKGQPDPDVLMSPPDMCAMMRVASRTFKRLLSSGRLPHPIRLSPKILR